MPPKIDSQTELDELKTRCEELAGTYADRDKDFDKYEEAYKMELSIDAPEDADIIVSPDAVNTVEGAIRLMIATDPIINIRKPSIEEDYSQLEKFLDTAFDMAGRIHGTPIHYELITSAMLYGEMHCSIILTKDLVNAAKKNKRAIPKFERIAKMTPWLLRPLNPHYGYPEFGSFGLSGYYRKVDTTVRRILEDYGAYVTPEFQARNKNETMTLHTWVDDDYSAAWTDSEDLLYTKHELAAMPVVVQITDGSFLFDDPEDQRRPLLYTLMKSGIWEHQSAALSAMYHYAKNLGAIPLFLHRAPEGKEGKQLYIDYSPDRPYGVVELEGNEEFQPVTQKGIIDPSISQVLDISRRLTEESTIYKAALGAPPEGASTFSELSLLATSGRLPLIGTQRRGGWGIAAILEAALTIQKGAGGGKASTFGAQITSKDIPDPLLVDVKLDINLPEDKLQTANVAAILMNKRLASREWIQTNILQMPQPEDIAEQAWSEEAADAMFTMYMQQQMQQLQQTQQPNPAAPGAGAPGGALPPGQPMPGEMPPEMIGEGAGPAMNPDQAAAIEGMPPQMAGMVRGQGQGMGLPPAGGLNEPA